MELKNNELKNNKLKNMKIKVNIKDFPKPKNLCLDHNGKDICPEIS
jgi:hypothetical protein